MSDFKSKSPSSSSVSLAELKLYQAFIFSVPIFFTFVLLFLFYLFYLRRRRVDWASLRMRADLRHNNDVIRAELGLKKELREMLPIVVYKESFSVKDTQCTVCLADYRAEDRLQQIPACGHTFHMECIDHWLANHTTCPLCRLSLIQSARLSIEPPNNQAQTVQESRILADSTLVSHPHNEASGTANTANAQEGQSGEHARIPAQLLTL